MARQRVPGALRAEVWMDPVIHLPTGSAGEEKGAVGLEEWSLLFHLLIPRFVASI